MPFQHVYYDTRMEKSCKTLKKRKYSLFSSDANIAQMNHAVHYPTFIQIYLWVGSTVINMTYTWKMASTSVDHNRKNKKAMLIIRYI